MGIKVSNATPLSLTIKDCYILDPVKNCYYEGALEYVLHAGGSKHFKARMLMDKMMEESNPQQIHINNGEDTLLVLHHEDFINNKEAIFTMDEGNLSVRFTPANTTNSQNWSIFTALRSWNPIRRPANLANGAVKMKVEK